MQDNIFGSGEEAVSELGQLSLLDVEEGEGCRFLLEGLRESRTLASCGSGTGSGRAEARQYVMGFGGSGGRGGSAGGHWISTVGAGWWVRI